MLSGRLECRSGVVAVSRIGGGTGGRSTLAHVICPVGAPLRSVSTSRALGTSYTTYKHVVVRLGGGASTRRGVGRRCLSTGSSGPKDIQARPIQWSNPRDRLAEVPRDVVYSLPPPLKPPLPQTVAEERMRTFKSFLPFCIGVVVGTIVLTRRNLNDGEGREWIEEASPSLAAMLSAAKILDKVPESIASMNRVQLFERMFDTYAGGAGDMPTSEALQLVNEIDGGAPGADRLGAGPVVARDDFVRHMVDLSSGKSNRVVASEVQRVSGVQPLTAAGMEEFRKLYGYVQERNGAKFSPASLNAFTSQLGFHVLDKDDAAEVLSRTSEAKRRAGGKAVKAGDMVGSKPVLMSEAEFLNLCARVSNGWSDEDLGKYTRVFYFLDQAGGGVSGA